MNLDGRNLNRSDRIAPIDLARVIVPASKLLVRLRLYVLMLVLDCAAVLGAFAIAGMLHAGRPWAHAGVKIVLMLLPLYALIALNRDVYTSHIFTRWRASAYRAASSLTAAVFAVLFVAFYLRAGTEMSRGVMALGSMLSLAVLVAIRFGMHRFGRHLFAGDPFVTLVLKDGAEVAAPDHAIVIDAAAMAFTPDVTDPHALDRLGRLLMRADRIVVACPPERRAAWAAVVKGANIRGEIVVPELDTPGFAGVGSYHGQPTLLVAVGPLDMRNRALKRGLDLVLSVLALIVLAPLMALTALAVKLSSPGPVLFVQPRLGRGNRLFPMVKFRSMRTEMCDVLGATSTARDDARVTAVGRIIRATSIDELPQILNVLRGDMSIVGPRPHALGSLAGDKLFWEVDQRYWHRHATKPGITGLAQIRGFRGATHMTSDLTSRLQADLDYLNGWTLWRDVSILLATFKVVLHKNAY